MAALAAFALALHVHFAAIDVRPAVDLGHVWSGAIRAARDGAPSDTPYAALVAALWRGFGRTGLVLEALDGLWTVALVVGLGLAGYRAGGAAGASVAASAGVLFPLFPTAARTHWIHHPEAGAAALALGLAAGGPTIRYGLPLGAVAGVAATVRPSAAIWLLIPLLLWTWRVLARGRFGPATVGEGHPNRPIRDRSPTESTGSGPADAAPTNEPSFSGSTLPGGASRSRFGGATVGEESTRGGYADRSHLESTTGLLLAAWAPFLLGVAAIAPSLPGYLALRVSVREATAIAVGSPLALLPVQTGPLAGGLALVLALRGAWRVLGEGRAGRPPPWDDRALVLAAAAWGIAGLAVILASGAGPDNVPVVFVGLAVLAAAGAVDLPRVPLTAVLALLLALGPGAQLWPRLGVAGAPTGWRTADEPLNWLVPNPLGFSEEDLRRGIEAACPPAPARCRLVVERGLVHPSWEDDGALALFLAGIDHVDPVTAPVWDGRGADAAVAIACRGPAPDARARFPGAEERFDAAIARMRSVEERVGNGCARRWYARNR